MLQIVVVDASAASRQQLCERFQEHVRSQFEEFPLLPTYSIQPLSPNELRFHGTPDICILGPEMLRSDLLEVSRVRALFPHASILVSLTTEFRSLGVIEQLARLGADDVLFEETSSDEFVRKLLLLSRRAPARASGHLILLDGAKGGVGITSLTAALGEALVELGKSVTLVDGDFESQDLSRFLQAKPFVNENLRLILDEQRPITKEYVDHCSTAVWGDAPGLRIVPPPPETEDLWAPTARQGRVLASFFETLELGSDIVLVDVGSLRGIFRDVLYRIADRVICVVNNDPASLFASIDRIERIRRQAGADGRISIVENGSFSAGVSNQLLREEFARAARVDASDWMSCTIPFCRKGSCWPASGGTLLSVSSARVNRTIKRIAQQLIVDGTVAAAPEATPKANVVGVSSLGVSAVKALVSRWISGNAVVADKQAPAIRTLSHDARGSGIAGRLPLEARKALTSSSAPAEGARLALISESKTQVPPKTDEVLVEKDELVSRVKIAS